MKKIITDIFPKTFYEKLLFIFMLSSLLLGRLSDSATINSIPFIILIFIAITSLDFYTNELQVIFIFITFLISCASFYFQGILEAKDLFLSLAGFISTRYFVHKYKFEPKIFFLLYIFFFIPQFLYEYILSGGKNLSYIPLHGYINVITSTATKHGTSNLGIVLIMTSIFYLIKKKRIALYVFFFFLSLYFIIFSGARGGIISIAIATIIYFLNRVRYRKVQTYIILLIAIFYIFAADVYAKEIFSFFSNNKIISNYFGGDRADSNITSGRDWLWQYHIHQFLDSYLYLGKGRKVVDFGVGDFIPGTSIIATAGSESPLTALLACYGIIGIIILIIYFRTFTFAVKNKNILGTLFAAIAILQAVGTGANYFSFMSYTSVIFFNLYWKCFSQKSFKN